MPMDTWRSRGYGSRPTFRRSTSLYPPDQDYYKQQQPPRSDKRSCCFHYQQQSAQMNEDMSRRLRLGEEQKRLADKLRICAKDTEHCPEFLRKQPLSDDVTLSIEVSNTDYSSIIGLLDYHGSEDDSIPLIMSETGVRVQFPDISPSGDNANSANKVKLIGPLCKVEEARRRIRRLSFVTVAFPIFVMNAPIDKVRKSLETLLNDRRIVFPGLKITIECRPSLVSQFFREMCQSENVPVCTIRGPLSAEERIYEACDKIYDYVARCTDEEVKRFAVSWMDIPMSQQLAVTGFPNGVLMRWISYKSSATIIFPFQVEHRVGSTMFYITGSTRSVLVARKYIQGLLPVTLSFEVENSDLVEPPSQQNFCHRDEKMDVKVCITGSTLDSERLFDDDPVRNHVVIESTEHNLINIYKMRQKLLGLNTKDISDYLPNDYDFIDDDFRRLVAETNKYISEGSNNVEALVAADGTIRIPTFDPKVPAPYYAGQNHRHLDGWHETVRPQQAWLVGGIQPAPGFGGPFYFSQAAAPQFCPPIRHTSSLPSFNYPQYHSPSSTIMSEDRSLAESKADHSQCSSTDAPTNNTVQLFLDSFRGRDTKSTSNFKRHNLMN